ncbi:secreted RxLR effector protein 161-like [Nicotiana tabacum]|uniref:Secreted RxLR effector protein 161-like n=1 Tax=Nicotiana tabacum TaxID=4097 RepID=A0AC58RXD9_TOBAC
MDKDKDGKSVDETMYRGMIGSLLYLTSSRPDVMFSICKCARYQLAPKESHLTVVKRIIRYLIGTVDYRLWYESLDIFDLKGFSDADFAGDKIDRKRTSGTCQLLGKYLISWHNKKQCYVAISTTEAEYLVVGNYNTQVLWIFINY